MLSGGARRLAALYAVKPGDTAVVATTGDRGLDAALALHAAGVRVAAVADLRPDAGGGELAARVAGGGHRAAARARRWCAALGRQARRPARCSRRSTRDGSRARGHASASIACDLLAVSRRRGARRRRCCCRAARRRATTSATGRFVAERLHRQRARRRRGRRPRGRRAAPSCRAASPAPRRRSRSGFGDAAARDRARARAGPRAPARPAAPAPVATPPAIARDRKRGGKAFVDLDEDVTVKDIAYAVAEGYDSIELSKRYTTVTMGPSQGRFSQLAGDPRARRPHRA